MNWTEYLGDPAVWDAQIETLGGGIYQSHAWGEVRRSAGWKPLRLLGSESGRTVAAASILVRRHAGVSVCWIPGGPAGPMAYFTNEFRHAIGELVKSRLIYCRMNILREEKKEESETLMRSGWRRPQTRMGSGLTMLYSLDGNNADRMARASGNWRHNLKRSGRHGLKVEAWLEPDEKEIAALYREMEGLKSLPVQHSEAELAAIMKSLKGRLMIYRCLDAEGALLAVRAAGLFGTCALDLLAVAGVAARKVYASHATLWALLEGCHQAGMRQFDLSGVDPVGNKGVYDFKQGTGARLVECAGEWDWASFPGMRIAINMAMRHKGMM